MTSPTNNLRVGSYQFHHYLDGGGRHTTVSLEPHAELSGWLGTSRVTRDKHGGAWNERTVITRRGRRRRDLQVWRGAGVLGPAPLRRHPPKHPAVRHARERGPPSPPR